MESSSINTNQSNINNSNNDMLCDIMTSYDQLNNVILIRNSNNNLVLPVNGTTNLSTTTTTISTVGGGVSGIGGGNGGGNIIGGGTTNIFIGNIDNNSVVYHLSSSSTTSSHQLISTNSFEFNAATTSLSEDSGLPHTNSSISSGDSSRLGLCKFEFELAESDGEVSQFDSLENCSDGGMSAENFNTLKKGPLAPIDPPPEFQDSPQTTLQRSPVLQSFTIKFTNRLIKNAIESYKLMLNKTSELSNSTTNEEEEEEHQHQLPPTGATSKPKLPLPIPQQTLNEINNKSPKLFKLKNKFTSSQNGLYENQLKLKSYEIYASDSLLNRYSASDINNIYDIPNNDDDDDDNADDTSDDASDTSIDNDDFNISNNNNYLENDYDDSYSVSYDNFKLKSPKNKKSTTDHCKIKQQHTQSKIVKSQKNKSDEIYDYDLYYSKKNKQSTSIGLNNANNTGDHNILKHTQIASAATSTTTSTNLTISSTTKSSTSTGSSQYNTNQKNYYQQPHNSRHNSNHIDTFHQWKKPTILYSPLHYPHHYHHHHHHHHGNNLLSINNRPNSRNSLNSRLSSSHNSLTIQTTNKADDSIFITQAMSHDALTGREIADFYNVPIDSDIYALPIDVIKPNQNSDTLLKKVNGSHHHHYNNNNNNNKNIITNGDVDNNNNKNNLRTKLKHINNHHKKRRRKHQQNNITNGNANGIINESINNQDSKYCGNGGGVGFNRIKITKSNDKRHSVPENTVEPMHMSLDEVKRFYHSLYSSSSESSDTIANKARNRKNYYNHNENYNTGIIVKSGERNGTLTSTHTNNPNTTNNGNISNTFSTVKNNIINKTSTINVKNKKLTNKVNEVTNTNINNNSNNNLSNTNLINNNNNNINNSNTNQKYNTSTKKSQFSINLNLKQKFCSIFRFRKSHNHSASTSTTTTTTTTTTTSQTTTTSGTNNNNNDNINNNNNNNNNSQPDYNSEYYDTTMNKSINGGGNGNGETNGKIDKKIKFQKRALPPLPSTSGGSAGGGGGGGDSDGKGETSSNIDNDVDEPKLDKKSDENNVMDFAANIEKVKEYGWYWGPISSEVAEKILSNEPDGSFIVRDSSDDHYIFSLTFKLNNSVRHVRIEQDQGTFSFGSCAKFKSRTIMEFIENAVESSRSGRYLFFFHRRPEHGPMRVQLTNPVSRFKHIQSLQHMCRFVIRKAVVRKDLIQTLPLPRRLLDYLSYKNCYSEQVDSDSSQSEVLQIFSGCQELDKLS